MSVIQIGENSVSLILQDIRYSIKELEISKDIPNNSSISLNQLNLSLEK